MLRRHFLKWLAVVVAAVAVAAGLWHTQAPPSGPQPIAWDREKCAECGMLISDHRFAAQLQTSDGQTLNFDDPGCLMAYLARNHVTVRETYFQNKAGGGWLSAADVGFLRSPDSPMGRGWAAVSHNTPGSVSFHEAARWVSSQFDH